MAEPTGGGGVDTTVLYVDGVEATRTAVRSRAAERRPSWTVDAAAGIESALAAAESGPPDCVVAGYDQLVFDEDDAPVLGDDHRRDADELTQRDRVGKRLARGDEDRRVPVAEPVEQPGVDAAVRTRHRPVDVDGDRGVHVVGLP